MLITRANLAVGCRTSPSALGDDAVLEISNELLAMPMRARRFCASQTPPPLPYPHARRFALLRHLRRTPPHTHTLPGACPSASLGCSRWPRSARPAPHRPSSRAPHERADGGGHFVRIPLLGAHARPRRDARGLLSALAAALLTLVCSSLRLATLLLVGLVPDQSPTQLERATREAVAGGRLNAPMLAREEECTELPLADGGSDASRQERCAPKSSPQSA